MIQFFVPGNPIAQGSKRHVGGGRLVESSREFGPWRQAVAHAAKEAANGDRLEGPLRLRAIFYFRPPQSHFRTGRYAGLLKDGAPKYRIQAPDLDKLTRALFDALSISGVIPDDRVIAVAEVEKWFGDPGVLVALEEIP